MKTKLFTLLLILFTTVFSYGQCTESVSGTIAGRTVGAGQVLCVTGDLLQTGHLQVQNGGRMIIYADVSYEITGAYFQVLNGGVLEVRNGSTVDISSGTSWIQGLFGNIPIVYTGDGSCDANIQYNSGTNTLQGQYGTSVVSNSANVFVSGTHTLWGSMGSAQSGTSPCSPSNPEFAHLDFDGVDDYVDREDIMIDTSSYVVLSAWVNPQDGVGDEYILGEGDAIKLWLDDGTPKFTINFNGGTEITLTCSNPDIGTWFHISGRYIKNSTMELYINGIKEDENTSLPNKNIVGHNGDDFQIGRNSSTSSEYFEGSIDEVKLFYGNSGVSVIPTEEQIRQMICQEIEEDGDGEIIGSVIGKKIKEYAGDTYFDWGDLRAYYPFTNITTDVDDYSDNSNTLVINSATVMEQTTPLPYVTTSDGDWTTEGTWEHGDVWDIEDIDFNDYRIVQISHDVSMDDSTDLIGLIVDDTKTLTVESDFKIESSWYVELNGTIDLLGDSQLVQTSNSDLVTDSDGNILRRQEGQTNKYRYNYWASPVGSLDATLLIDNNTTSNNTNNSPFTLDMLQDGTGTDITFVGSNTPSSNEVSTRWLYKYQPSINRYWGWEKIETDTELSPGVGYTQKGSSLGTYIFEGKPNNGTILVDVDDIGGTGSDPLTTETICLVGNPYPSALDISQFIDDNEGIIGDGTLSVWEQWAGDSHYWSQYEGGYIKVNKLGAVKASQFIGIHGLSDTGGEEGNILYTKYLPVGQGFFVEVENDGVLPFDGTIEFNNNQRVFIKESDADGTFGNGSVFAKGKKSKPTIDLEPSTIRFKFTSMIEGEDIEKEILLGFGIQCTDGYDYGWDSINDEPGDYDLGFKIGKKMYDISGYSLFDEDKVIPLKLMSSGLHLFTLQISELRGLPDNQPIYLKDNFYNSYYDLTERNPYVFNSQPGVYSDRFEIVFKNMEQTLGTNHIGESADLLIYNNGNNIYINNLEQSIDDFKLIDMSGKRVLEYKRFDYASRNHVVPIHNIPSGFYIVYMMLSDGRVLSKKLFIE